MARTFTQVPPDSTGDKLTMQTFVVASDTFHTQGVYNPGLPTYRAVSADITRRTRSTTRTSRTTRVGQTVYILRSGT
jgi:hypothetical protein